MEEEPLVSVDLDLAGAESKTCGRWILGQCRQLRQKPDLPAEQRKSGGTEYAVELNTASKAMGELSDLAHQTVDGAVIHLVMCAGAQTATTKQNVVRNEAARRLATVYQIGRPRDSRCGHGSRRHGRRF